MENLEIVLNLSLRFMTPDEMARLIEYLRDKRDRLVRSGTDAGNFISSPLNVVFFCVHAMSQSS